MNLRTIVILIVLQTAGCGYRLAGSGTTFGEGRTLSVPTFVNQTTNYRIEQRLSEAVRREFIRRTRYRVTSRPAGDVVVRGEVLGFQAIPVIFNEEGRGSSYTVLVDVKLEVEDTRDGRILFRNDRWSFREIFELGQNSEAFVGEDSAAMNRLAGQMAASLVAALTSPQP